MKRKLKRKISFDIKCIIKAGFLSLLAGLMSLQVYAQGIRINGSVTDDGGELLSAVSVSIQGTTQGVMTDDKGEYSITVPNDTAVLIFSSVGYRTQNVNVGKRRIITVVMKEDVEDIGEVTVVAFAKQSKESVIASISTIKPSELKIPSSNLTTALGGRIAGIISYQRSGEPGKDDAQFFIRGVTTFGYTKSPLVLIDNIESSSSDLGRLQPDDIASFSIMKDASATALYGARGANGVILVTTKEGREGKAVLNVRLENSFSSPVRNVDVVDPVNYMRLHNEAVLTRNPLAPRPYSMTKINATANGGDPYMYPAVNWYDEMFKDYAANQRVNANLSGGGQIARYYIAATVNNDNGIIKVDPKNNFNNNISLQRIQLRSNTNINVTKTTEVNVRISGTFEDYSGPMWGGDQLYQAAMAANPVRFPKYYLPNEELSYVKHILFGNAGAGNFLNPYAETVKGYQDYSQSGIVAQLELKQKLDFVAKGLGLRIMGNTTRDSFFNTNRFYNPFYYSLTYYDRETGQYGLTCLNPNGGKEDLGYEEGSKNISTTFYGEAALDYSHTFAEKHTISGLLVGIMRESLNANAGDLQKSLAYRNLGLSGRFTYAYDSRYFAEFNFGYNGSERFYEKERFGFFPSIGGGYIISNEKFWGRDLKKIISKLKVKGTYGIVGNDAIGGDNDRFFYLSNVDLNNGNYQKISFGKDFTNRPAGISISRYANEFITWETSKKMNLGLEIGLLNKIEIQADYFTEYRSNILMDRIIPSTMGLQAGVRANVGEASSQGFEFSVDANHSFTPDLWISGRANFTYATSKFRKYEEPEYPYAWRSWVGLAINQVTGLIAERLFIDEADIANSPRQTYGEYMPGDIKYMDINDDGIIDDDDIVPIGYPSTPGIMYGFGLSAGYKGFDLSFFFQGSGRSSFYIDPTASAPFLNLGYGGRDTNNAMLQAWANSYWSEENRDIYALWPRLSAEKVSNNMRGSTWFLRDGSFIRLKSVEIGYTLPQNLIQRLKMSNLRIYASGLNLLLFSKFKTWDVEMSGNGLGYPIQKVINIGLNVGF
ncbi:MAG: TonB-dependent receptor [Prevotellaceae bacterium]|jgi:TonB-linked SusC/RagA family outer membrane protein|nr:TonB-dependent receptor [Prevotellaceae bacterium]